MTTSSAAQVDLSRPYFIGIGGIGMSGLARICVARGAAVAGSDAQANSSVAALRELGCVVHIGHDAAHVPDASCVVVSSAVREDNPELLAARERGIPVAHRSEALSVLMADRRAVVVAGTHGKSSTSGMLAVALAQLGLDPSYAVGADIGEPGSNARYGDGDLFVAEADESDRSFHRYQPAVAIVLNVEEDHHDHYGSLEEHFDSYETFAARVEPGGLLVLCADDVGACELRRRLAGSLPGLRTLMYGIADYADVRIEAIESRGLTSSVSVRLDGRPVRFEVNAPGRHIAHNAVGALAMMTHLGVEPERAGQALGAYRGIDRRFTRKGERGGVTVVDSYAHHPTEVAADLATAREVIDAAGEGRVMAVFQPHLYTRTRALGADNGEALAAADIAVIMSVYGGREEPIPGVTSALVIDSARAAGAEVVVENTWAAVPATVAGLAWPGDLVLTMGAGDVTRLGPLILDALAARERDA